MGRVSLKRVVRGWNARLLPLHMDKGAFGEVVAVELGLHDVVY